MLEMYQLSKTYGRHQALTGVSFQVAAGEVMGLLGVNGSGKTTLLRILAGAIAPTGGTAKIDGYDLHRQARPARQRVGYLPETMPLYLDMNVTDYLDFVAAIGQVPRTHRKAALDQAIDRCGLGDRRRQLIRQLSQGYRQRVGLAQAIIANPPVLLLDEPTRGLDPQQVVKMRQLIGELAADHTIMVSSHILSEVQATCQRVAILHQGELLAVDTPEGLAQRWAMPYAYRLTCDAEHVPDLLHSLSAITQVVRSPNITPSQWYITATADISSQLVATLVAGEVAVLELRREQASLEQVFVALTAAAES